MNNYESSLDQLLRNAADYLKSGRKDEARELLREALAMDRNNLATWELLWHAAYTTDEEVSSLGHI
jgi:Tfp pilus assembly protein PilF